MSFFFVFKREITRMQEQHDEEMKKVKSDLERERAKNVLIDSKAATALGAKREKKQNNEFQDLVLELEMSHVQVEQLQLEKDSIVRENEKSQMTVKGLLVENDLLNREKNALKKASKESEQIELENARQSEKTSQVLRVELENELSKVRDELQLAEKRNSWYEEKYDLFDAVKYQKKLEADVRRRDFDLKSQLILLGEKDDQINLLKKACNTMKSKLGPDHELDEKELKVMIAIDENSLQNQNRELNRQIEALEQDRLDLMKRLRENAAAIGENGIRFVGLDAEQIMQVTDFAKNIKDGTLQLPLNDRSMELTAKLSKMEAEKVSDSITIDRLEREIEMMQTTKDVNQGSLETELYSLRKMLLDIQGQNKTLRSKIELLSSNDNARSEETTISPFDRQRIERIIGETLQPDNIKTVDQFQCFLKEYIKLESELSIMKASIQRVWSRPKSQDESKRNKASMKMKSNCIDTGSNTLNVVMKDNEAQTTNVSEEAKKVQNVMLRTFNFIEDSLTDNSSEYQSIVKVNKNSHNRTFVGTSTLVSRSTTTDAFPHQDFQCQVCIGDTRDSIPREISDKLRRAENDLILYELKTKRLKNALQQATSSKSYEKRILLAQASVEQLKAILDKKNKIIRKYRNKCISAFSDRNEMTDERRVSRNLDEFEAIQESYEEQQYKQTEAILIQKLNETTCLLKEKEQKVHLLQSELGIFKDSAQVNESRYNDLIMEMSKLRVTNNELKERFIQVESCAKTIGNDHVDTKACFEVERNNLERLIDEAKAELRVKDNKIERMKSHISQLKIKLKDCEESAKEVPVLKSEVKRMKIELNIFKRSRDRWERALSVSKSKAADVIEDMEKLETQVHSLRKEAVVARKTKLSVLSKSKRLANRLKEVQESADKEKGEMKQRNDIDDYKKRIAMLKEDNMKLRGVVASYAMKNKEKDARVDGKGGKANNLKKNKNEGKFRRQDRHFRGRTDKECQTEFYFDQEKSGSSMGLVHDPVQNNDHQLAEKKGVAIRPTWLYSESKQAKQNIESKQSFDLVTNMKNRNDDLTIQNQTDRKAINELRASMLQKEKENQNLQTELKQMRSLNANDKENESMRVSSANRLFMYRQQHNAYNSIDLFLLKRRQSAPHSPSSDSDDPAPNANDIILLREELRDLKRQLSVTKDEKMKAIDGSNQRIHELKVENSKLKQELSSFTLDFFEEIEDLKFNYNEAKKKLALYEGDETNMRLTEKSNNVDGSFHVF